MTDLNQTMIIGRLGKDPELRTAGDTTVTSFSVACGWKTKSKEGTEWFNVEAWGKLGELCAQYIAKGSKVFVQGGIRTDKYTDKDGIERYRTKLIAEKVQFLDSKQDGAKPQQQPPQNAAPVSVDDLSDDIPF
jgi:single-strand DNA-binding protein